MSSINKEIKQYLVQLEFNGHTSDKRNGSGVIVKVSANSIYIFTAKHTFEKDKDETERGSLYERTEIIKYTKIFIIDKEELFIEDIIVLDNIQENIDFIILKIKNNISLEEKSPLLIYNDEFEKCTVSGFPKVNDYKELTYIPSIFIHSDKDYYFEFDPKKIVFTGDETGIEIMGGISGGGVFVKGNDGVIYLAGIETGLYGVNNLEAIYLIRIIEKINEKLGTEIPLGGFKTLSGFENQPLSLEFLSDNLKNEYINDMEDEDNILDVLEDDKNEKYKKLETEFNDTKKSIRELSISYLYRGIKFNGYNNYKATANFKKAISLNKEEVEIYFHLAKSKRTPHRKQIDINLDDENKKRLIEINKLKDEIEDSDEYENLEELYNELLYLLRKDNLEDEVVNYKKKLINLYLQNKEFNQAERELTRKNLEFNQSYITQQLTQIYLNEEYTKQLNDEEVAKKLFDLLALIENESDKDRIRLKIDELNLYNQNMLILNEKFSTMEHQIKNYQSKIEILTGKLSSDTKNKNILEQVLQTDEKLDTVSINLSNKIDLKINKVDKKLDVMTSMIKRTNNKNLDNFLENIYASNKALIHKLQMGNHQDNRRNVKLNESLDKSIKIINDKLINIVLSENKQDNSSLINEVKTIVQSSNWNFYQGIKALHEKSTDSYQNKLLKMSIAWTEKENELHIENLEKLNNISLEEKDKEVKGLNQWLDTINEKYESEKVKSEAFEIKASKLKEINTLLEENLLGTDSLRNGAIDLEKYELEIRELNELVLKLKGKNEQINDLKESITLSSKTADTLQLLANEEKNKVEIYIQKIEQKYEEIDERKKNAIEKQFYKIVPTIKNQRRYRKVIKYVKRFEEGLAEIKHLISAIKTNNNVKCDPKITLKLLQSDLEKIELIMQKSRLPFYSIYCQVRAVFLSSTLVLFIITVLLNEPFSSWLQNFSLNDILNFIKN